MSHPTKMTIADGIEPRPDWNRPHRISLLQKLLSEKEVPEAKVYLGGERFTFMCAERCLNVVIYCYSRTGHKIVVSFHKDEASIRGEPISPLVKKEPGKKCTEEEVIAMIGEVLTELV